MVRRGFWVRVAAGVVRSWLVLFTRQTWRGLDRVPATGGVIIVPNHLSQVDPMVVARFVYQTGRTPRFLAKSSLFGVPVLGPIMRACGQVPVYRGSADAARSLAAAAAAVRRGEAVVVYPEGTTTRQPEHWPMRGKTGVARLALATGAPVIPVAQWGAQRIYDPIRRKLRLRPRTPVVVQAGPPVDLSRWPAGTDADAAAVTGETLNELTDQIMYRVRDLLAELRGEQAPADLYQWRR